MEIHKVWKLNFKDEMLRLHHCLFHFPIISLDTEFPGCLSDTRRQASDIERYEILKYNVNNLKIIQLGLTLSNHNGIIGGTWEFNFCDFDPEHDNHAPASLDFLIKHGFNFKDMRQHGINTMEFGFHFRDILRVHNTGKLRWVTFHGLYDITFVLKMLNGSKPLPDSLERFAMFVGMSLGTVFDLKFMSVFCNDLNHGKIGLEKLSNNLNVTRIGGAHQAGSDSLLTSCVFIEMMKKYKFLQQTEKEYEGIMYGIKSARFIRQCDPRLVMTRPIYVSQVYEPVFVGQIPFIPITDQLLP